MRLFGANNKPLTDVELKKPIGMGHIEVHIPIDKVLNLRDGITIHAVKGDIGIADGVQCFIFNIILKGEELEIPFVPGKIKHYELKELQKREEVKQ